MATHILPHDGLTLIDTFEKIASIAPELALSLPKCVFLGPQSCGKSSLISKITTLPLHVDCGTTTRCPTEIRTRVHDCDPEFKVTIRVVEDTDGNPVTIKELRYQDWQPISTAGSVLKKANLEAMFPILRGEDAVGFREVRVKDLSIDDQNNKASQNVVIVEARGRSFLDITVVDLPGIKSTDVGTSAIRKLAESYAEKENVLIVSCHSGDSEYGNQPAAPIALKCDPFAQRTINVLNKADRLAAENTTYSECFPNRDNWFATCGNEAIATETSFWQQGAVRSLFQDTPQERLGVANVTRHIQLRMHEIRLNSFPKWDRLIHDLRHKAKEQIDNPTTSDSSSIEAYIKLISKIEIYFKDALLVGTSRKSHPALNTIRKRLADVAPSLRNVVPQHVPFQKGSAKAIECARFFCDHFSHVAPTVEYYEEIAKVCQGHTEGGIQDSYKITSAVQHLLHRMVPSLMVSLHRAIEDLWACIGACMDEGLSNLGKPAFAAQMGRRIFIELESHKLEMNRTASRAVQGLITCTQAHLDQNRERSVEVRTAYKRIQGNLGTPPGTPGNGMDDLTDKVNEDLLICVAFQTMATSMRTTEMLADNVQMNFFSHLTDFVNDIGRNLRDECELTADQPSPGRKRKLEMMMDDRTPADKERAKKSEQNFQKIDGLHKHMQRMRAVLDEE